MTLSWLLLPHWPFLRLCGGCENVPANLQLRGANWPQTSTDRSLKFIATLAPGPGCPQELPANRRAQQEWRHRRSPWAFLPSLLPQGEAQTVIWHLSQLLLAQKPLFFPHRLLLSKIIHTILSWYLPSRRPRLTPILFIYLFAYFFPLTFASQIHCVPHDSVHNFPFPSILVETYSFQYSLHLPQPKYVSLYQSVPLGCMFIFAK